MSISKSMDKVKRKVQESILEGIKEGLNDLSKESLKECPVDTGDMRRSYKVEINGAEFLRGAGDAVPVISNDIKGIKKGSIDATASYETSYVIKQHEDLTLNHPTPGTKAKFLEDPTKKHEKQILETIKKKMKGGMG